MNTEIMKGWKTDDEMFRIIRSSLYTAVIGDIMDKMNYSNQFLSPRIQPLKETMVVAGRAFTVLESDVHNVDKSIRDKPFGLMLEALDELKKNEVYVCTGASPSYALWGELMSTRAMKLGAVGAVVDGYSRDTRGIIELNFPTFSYGRYSQDQAPRGKVIDYGIPITMNGVQINPGDIIVGDLDGVCVIPLEIKDEVIRQAIEKAKSENTVKIELEKGMSACDAFSKYGVL